MSAFLGFAPYGRLSESVRRALLGGVAAFPHALFPAIGLLAGGTRAPLGSDERGPGRQKGVEGSDGAVRPPAGLCRRPRSGTVMPLLMKPFNRRQAPRCRGGARAVLLRQAAEARRRSRRTSSDAAESGGGNRRRMPPRRWPRPGGSFARSLSADLWPNLSAAARASTRSPAGSPAWAADDAEVASPCRPRCTRRHQHQSPHQRRSKARRRSAATPVHTHRASRPAAMPPSRERLGPPRRAAESHRPRCAAMALLPQTGCGRFFTSASVVRTHGVRCVERAARLPSVGAEAGVCGTFGQRRRRAGRRPRVDGPAAFGVRRSLSRVAAVACVRRRARPPCPRPPSPQARE
jgi:hypothetical protein